MPLSGTLGFSVALFFLSATAMAESAAPTDPASPTKHPPVLHKAATSKAKPSVRPRASNGRIAIRPTFGPPRLKMRPHLATAGLHDRYGGSTRSAGAIQVGRASWYGGHHLGMHTASGTILDSMHATAAHRTLPLNSLARVTNMKNGRSVVVVVNDRGPTSPRLIIDLSPRAAQELDMVRDGIVPVTVEPLAMRAVAAR
jgi:peptidoglycan lytic transglycosylase